MQCSNDNDNGFTEHGSILSAVLWPFSFGYSRLCSNFDTKSVVTATSNNFVKSSVSI